MNDFKSASITQTSSRWLCLISRYATFCWFYSDRQWEEERRFAIRIIANGFCHAGTRRATQIEVNFCKTSALNNTIVIPAEQTMRNFEIIHCNRINDFQNLPILWIVVMHQRFDAPIFKSQFAIIQFACF